MLTSTRHDALHWSSLHINLILFIVDRLLYWIVIIHCGKVLWVKWVLKACKSTLPFSICRYCDSLDASSVLIVFFVVKRFMVQQLKKGRLLCLCSRNVAEDVLKVFEQRQQVRSSVTISILMNTSRIWSST
jgi:hypothetical protein